jgi:biopolymer transport protein ExbD
MATAAAGSAHAGEMNVTPMIDILLVLLVIFMISQPNRMALEVQVPPPAAGPDNRYPQVVLELPADGGVAVNGQPVPAAEVEARLRTILAPRTVKLVYVKADTERHYQEVIGAVDLARGAGADVVAFMPPP